MKKVILSLVLSQVCLFATDQSLFIDNTPIPAEEIQQEDLDAYIEGKVQEIVVFCSENTRLPINFLLTGGIIDLDKDKESNMFLTVSKPFFLKISSEEVQFSWDSQEWLGFEDFFSGRISLEMSVDKEIGLPVVSLHFDLKAKDSE